jgi:signal transduction histidine kinase
MIDELSSVLVIEDNPTNLSFLFNLLNEAGFEVLVSQDGESALKAAEEAQPDIILLDVIMPDIDGFEICRKLKATDKTQEIPVIFMTALTKTVDKVRGFELGAVDYITKPIEPEEVLVRIKTHLTIQKLQQDLQIKNEQLQASLQREKELSDLKSRFMSIASHEFRTPLTAILFSSNLLKRYSKLVSDQKIVQDMLKEVQSIEKFVERMDTTLDEVLAISRAEEGTLSFNPRSVDLGKLCRNIVAKFKVMASETHTISFLNTAGHFQAVVDPKLIEQVLSNLLTNAIKYSPQGGTICCDLLRNGDEIILYVQDEGLGISDAEQPRVFEAFYRGANSTNISGTGLGLSIVKQFVELHHGRISVESQREQGTTFTVSLPLVE